MSPEQIELIGKFGTGAVIGALITAGFTFFTSWLTRQHEFRREKFKRKQELFEKISFDFESVHEVVIELYSSYYAYLETERVSPGTGSYSLDKACHVINEKISPAFSKIHAIEGRLMLLGYNDIGLLFVKYRTLSGHFQNIIPVDGRIAFPVEKWSSQYNSINELRGKIYEALKEQYDKV